MKFFNNSGYELSFIEGYLAVKKDVSPIKEILERKDISQFTFIDIEEIPLSETLPIAVNIIDVGQAIYYFKKNDFNKDLFIEEVSKLKEMKIETFYDVLNKVKALDEVTSSFNPLFVVYNPNGKFKIFEDCFKTLTLNNKTIYVSETDSTASIVGEIKDSTSKAKSYKEPKDKAMPYKKEGAKGFKFSYLVPIIKEEKYHFLFAIIATFLSSFTLSIAIYDSYAGKLICIFFYICSLAGAFLNFMIYKDNFKSFEIKTPQTILTAISSALGIGLGVVGYIIFKSLVKEVPAVQPMFILVLAMMILMYLISTSISVLFTYIRKRKK